MTTRRVPTSYSTISAAVAAAASGDVIAVAAGYAGHETVNVSVDNLTVSAPSTAVGIVLNLAPTVQSILLTGAAPIAVNGGAARDVIVDSGLGRTVLKGGAGNDTITANGGDTVDGGAGNDTINGNGGRNILAGGAGNDTITTIGTDTVDGGAGNDTIIAGIAADTAQTLKGGDGDDLFQFTYNDGGRGTLDGGVGIDTVRAYDLGQIAFSTVEVLDGYTLNSFRATIGQLAAFGTITASRTAADSRLSFALNGAGGALNLSTRVGGKRSVEVQAIEVTSAINIIGTGNADILVGTAYNDTLNGGAGNDTIDGGAGRNTLTGGAGNDTIKTTGRDTVDGGTGNDTIIAGIGADTAQMLKGGDGDDLFQFTYNDGGRGTLDGGAGIDTVRAYDLGQIAFSTVEILDGYSLPSFRATVGQLATFGTITASQAGADSRLSFVLSGAGGTLNLSTRVTGKHSVEAQADEVTSAVNIAGTGNADILRGSAYDDTLNGGAGNDTIVGGAGRNTLTGGTGNDTITTTGSDTVDAGAGNDTLIAGLGIDTVKTVKAGDGDDLFKFVYNDGGRAALDGGAGIDKIQGIYDLRALTLSGIEVFDGYSSGQGGGGVFATVAQIASLTTITDSRRSSNSQFFIALSGAGGTLDLATKLSGRRSVLLVDDGLTGGIVATGTAYNDDLRGSKFSDALYGGSGNDTIDGGAGGNDKLNGGAGVDTVSYRYLSDHVLATGVTVSLAVTGPQKTGSAGTDTLTGFENIWGSAYKDVLTGDSRDNVLNGDFGADLLIGGAGADTLDGGAGYDTLVGGVGADILRGGGTPLDTPGSWWRNAASYVNATSGVSASLMNPATNTGEAAGDTYDLISDLIGSSFGDVLTGGDGSNTLTGGAGNDILEGGGAVDQLDGGAGNDTVSYANSRRAVDASLASNRGDQDDDSFTSIENLRGSRYGDSLTGDGGNNLLDGLAGADRLDGGAGNDRLRGGGGKDILTGGAGSDRFEFDQPLVAGNLTTITDFASGGDTIALSLAIFAKAGAAKGALSPQAFFIGSAAHDGSDRIIYNSTNGNLIYDSDGTGSNAAVTIAKLGTHLSITSKDFQLF